MRELRRERFRELYRASEPSLAAWKPEDRPFARPLYDPAHVLLLTPAGADGVPARPASRPLWERVFASLDLPNPKGELEHDSATPPMTAAAVAQLVCLTNATARRERAETWFFGHRVFKDAQDADMEHVLVALRGHQRFRVLADTLERLGISDPAVYAVAMRRAQEIAEVGDRARQVSALRVFQGTLALLEHVRLARVVDVAFAMDAVKALSALPCKDGECGGGVAQWIDETLLPAIGRPGGQDSAEHVVLRAFGGRGPLPSGASPRVVDVEGSSYRIDPSAPVFARLRGVRERQGGWSLDDVLTTARHVRALGAASTAANVAEQAKALAADLATLRAANVNTSDPEVARVVEDLGEALDDLGKVRKDKDIRKAHAVAEKMHPRVEWCLGRVLAAIAYAPVLGDEASNDLLAGDPSTRHDFGLAVADTTGRVRNPWLLPAETHEGTGKWHIVGALLGMDVGLSRQALRPHLDRFTAAAADHQGQRPAGVRRSRGAGQRLRVPRRGPAAPRRRRPAWPRARRGADAVFGGCRGGDGPRPHRPDAARADSRGVSPTTRRRSRASSRLATSWTSDRNQAPRVSFRPRGARRGGPWTAASASNTRRPDTPRRLVGRYGKGLLAALVPDVTLLVAEAVADQGLPAELTLSVLAAATQDVIDGLRPAHDDDWVGVVAQVQQLVPLRVDDYVAAVMTGGMLVPVSEASDEQRH